MKKYLNIDELKYHKLIVFIYLIVTALPIISGSIINTSLFGLVIISLLILLFTTKDYSSVNNNYVIWIISFVIILLLSLLWTESLALSFGRLKRVLLITTFCIYISLLIKDKGDFNTALKIFIFSRLIMVIYILVTLDFTTLGKMRIGAGNLGEEWNANSIGMNLAFAAISVFFILKTERNKKTFKMLSYFFVILLFLFIIIFTGSRKALFILIFSIVLFSLIIKENNKITKLGFVFLSLLLLTYLSLNIPILYDVLGNRIEGLIANLTGDGVIDASTRTRMSMIEAGFEMFRQKPLLGYGIDSFRHLFFNLTGDFRYSHNNYIELLVSVGIIGTAFYYFGFIMIIKKAFFKRNAYLIFPFVVVITILIIDYGLVSYTSYLIQFFICLSFVSVRLKNTENKII